jgi:hypothetical protein
MKILRKTKQFPLYLILISVYPGISLLASNISQVNSLVVIRPLVVSILFVLLIYFVNLKIIKERRRAAIQTAVFGLIFFNYGHLYQLIFIDSLGISIQNIKFAHIILMVIVVCIYLLIRKLIIKRSPQKNTILLMSLALLLVPFFNIGKYYLTTRSTYRPGFLDSQMNNIIDERPDIYYIILDGYSRADTLELMGYDNSPFLNSLREIGFYVAECSHSNYRKSALSLASSLNMDYLNKLIPPDKRDEHSIQRLYNSIIDSRVSRNLKNIGYTIFAFETGYQWNEWERTADIYLKPGRNIILSPYLSEFEYMFIETTAIKAVLDLDLLNFLKIGSIRYGDYYKRVNYVLDTLPSLASQPGPKFVFAHILVPHAPFIFLPDGTINPRVEEYEYGNETGYINNVKFINSEIEQVVREIIEISEIPPVIIIQGDHGYIIEERRYFILNAYYLGGQDSDPLYPTISPVNSFKLIFNLYFDANLTFKKDQSFNGDIGNPFRIKPVDFSDEQSQCESSLNP